MTASLNFLKKAPELLDLILLAGEEHAQESFPLHADDQRGSQDGEQRHQDAHGQVAVVCSETQAGINSSRFHRL